MKIDLTKFLIKNEKLLYFISDIKELQDLSLDLPIYNNCYSKEYIFYIGKNEEKKFNFDWI